MSVILLVLLILPGAAAPRNPVLQSGSAEVRGAVTDETGAVITSAKVTLDDGQGHKYSAQSDQQGNYRINGVLAGKYTLSIEMEGFETFTQQLDLTEKRLAVANATMKVVIKEEQVVKESAPVISTEPDQNLSAIVLSGSDLDALPDDPDDMLTVLREMAGATEDATVYVDGFQEGGRLPPKEAIMAIRINSNPFAAEYSEPGFGRIEIITKPGTSQYHGGFRFNFNDSALNARNPFANTKPPLRLEDYNVFLSGPIIRNRWDFFFDFERRNLSQDSVVNAIVLAPTTLQPSPFVSTIVAPSTITNFSLRTNYLLTKSTTIGLWYRFTENSSSNQGLGGFALPEQAYSSTSRDNTLRFTLTNVLNERSVNQIHAEFSRRASGSQADTEAPSVNVVQAFTAGGNQGSLFSDNINRNLNLKDDLTYTKNKHSFKFGFVAYGTQHDDTNESNFGGTFSFQSDVERDSSGNPILDSSGKPIPISPIEHYRRTLLGAPGYHPSQFTITTGDPFVGFTQWQMGWYAQDDWRVSQRLTISYGLRHEFQNHLDAKLNFAPRFGLAWQPDKARKGTIRVGAGIFYTGLAANITQSAILGDGIHQQHLIVNEPTFFPNVPANLSGFTSSSFSSLQLKGPGLSDPYTIITSVSYDRQLPLKLMGSVGYTYERGVHLLRSRDLNEANAATGLLPNPNLGPILQFESSGLMRRNELKVSLRTGFSGRISLWANYILSQTNTDTDGAGTVPANSFDLATEYGPASYDQRHRFFIGSSILGPWQLRISPFIFAGTGRPFNITTGQDNNHDLIFNDRPAFATVGQPGAIVTPFGVFNPNPTPGELIIPRNFGDGPSSVSVNLGFTKTFGFGQAQQSDARRGRGGPGGPGGGIGPMIGGPGGPGGGGRGGFGGGGRGRFGGAPASRYTLTVGLFAQNLVNHTNLGNFNGVLTSPLFGLANTAQAGRRITLSARFNF